MEKKKLKIWQIIVILLVLIAVILIANVSRKMLILSAIQQKVAETENALSNYHVQKTYSGTDISYTSIDILYKDGNKKIVTNYIGGNSIIQFIYPTEERIFMNVGDEKIYSTAASSNTTQTIESAINEVSLGEAMTISIKTENVDEKDCYAIKGKLSGWTYETKVKDVVTYVEKESGLTVKRVEVLEDGTERVTQIQTSFNNVTDEDMQEPNIEEYKTSQN